jgi:hypothetical protein
VPGRSESPAAAGSGAVLNRYSPVQPTSRGAAGWETADARKAAAATAAMVRSILDIEGSLGAAGSPRTAS